MQPFRKQSASESVRNEAEWQKQVPKTAYTRTNQKQNKS